MAINLCPLPETVRDAGLELHVQLRDCSQTRVDIHARRLHRGNGGADLELLANPGRGTEDMVDGVP
jgi:hypothetical protein